MKTLKILPLATVLFILSCSKSDNEDPNLAVLTTTSVSGIAVTTAGSGGIISSEGGSAVTARGVVWGTTANPTIANNKTTDGSGAGSFTSNVTGLTGNTAYFVRAYATNSSGTSYGNQQSFTTVNAPPPGSTRVFLADIVHIRDGSSYIENSSEHVCMFIDGTSFDMDSYAVSYTVKFYDLVRTGGTPTTYPADQTYNFAANTGTEIINGTVGNYTYHNWYSASGNFVTRITPTHKFFVNIGWCTTTNCVDNCYVVSGKAEITVRY